MHGGRYRVLHPVEAGSVQALARDVRPIAEALGLDVYTARQRLVGAGVVSLSSHTQVGEADACLLALRSLDVPAFIFDREAPDLDPSVRFRGVRLEDDAVVLLGLEAQEVGRLGRDDRILAIPRHVRQPAELMAGTPHADAIGPSSAVDLITARGAWFVLQPASFNYGGLGERAGPGTPHNLRALLEAVRERVGALRLHFGFPPNHGRPARADQAAEYPRWVWAAWRAGLLNRPEPVPEPVPELERLVAAGAGSGPVLRSPPLRIWRGALAGVAYADRRRLLEWLAVGLGALTAAALAVRLLGGHRLAQALAIPLLAAGPAAAVFAARRLRGWRRVAEVPTSRIDVARLGLVELQGRAQPETPLTAPFSGRACVWYQVRLERWSVRPNPWRWLTWGRRWWWQGRHGGLAAATREGWEPVVAGDSDDQPFWLEDDTGRVSVEPEGAEWHLAEPVVREEVPSAGERYRVTERVVPVGAPLYVLGHLHRDRPAGGDAVVAALRALKADPRALAQYDLDGDGRIDAHEWDQARRAVEAQIGRDRAEGPARIARGPARGVFLISDRDEASLTRQLLRAGRAALTTAVIALVVALTLVLAF